MNPADRHSVMFHFDSECDNFRHWLGEKGRHVRFGVEEDEGTVYHVVVAYANPHEDPDNFFRDFRDIARLWYGLTSVIECEPLKGNARVARMVAWRHGEYPRKSAKILAEGRLVQMLQRGVKTVPRLIRFADGTECSLNLTLC